jgi:hypothetical protein
MRSYCMRALFWRRTPLDSSNYPPIRTYATPCALYWFHRNGSRATISHVCVWLSLTARATDRTCPFSVVQRRN